MHFRRKPTSRHENRRIETKRDRAATRDIFNGAHSRRTIRSGGWSHKPIQPPLLDEVPHGHPKRKQKKDRPWKTVCTRSEGHQFLKDIGVFTEERYDWKEGKFYTVSKIRRYRMCVHCGAVQFHSHVRSKYVPKWTGNQYTKLIRSATEEERQKV